jgi:phage terminase large subunit-like protein
MTNSKIFKLSDRTRNKEGRNIDFAIVDEAHEMKTNVIAKSVEQSQSLKDNPKFIIITTEGFVNDGFLDEELIKCRAILNGEDNGVMAERTLPWLYTQDSEAEIWQDETTWQKSNPTLGIVKKWDYLREQIDTAKRSKADRMFVLAKDFNIKVSNSQQWLMEEDYTYPATYELESFRNAFALGAVDLSETTDLTCAKVLLMRKDDKTKYVHTHYFIPESKLEKANDAGYGARYLEWAKAGHLTIHEGNENDLSRVADWFYSLYTDYGIRIIISGYDQRFAKDFLKKMDFYGFECEMVYQNKQTLSNAMKLAEADFKDQLINYNENPVDRWCLGNASMEMDSLGNVMAVKINNQAQRRIDGAVTLIILYEMYRRYKTELTNKL